MHDLTLNRLPLDERSLALPRQYPSLSPGYAIRVREDNLQWKRISRILQKHWRTTVGFAIVFLAVLGTVLFFMHDTYEATARIEISPPASNEAVSLHEENVQSSLPNEDYFQTQLEILRSDGLALTVIQNLHLDQNPELNGQQHAFPLLSKIKAGLGFGSKGPTGIEEVVRNFENHLSVNQVHSSQLVEIAFASRDPQLSSAVTNNLVETYLQKSRRGQYEATMAAAGALSTELNDLKVGVNNANQALIDYQQKYGIVDTGGGEQLDATGTTMGGGPQNPVTQRVVQLNRELTQAEADKLNQESYLRMVSSGNVSSLPQMRDSVVLQELQKRYAESEADLSQARAVYGENNSIVKKLRNETDELQKQMDSTRARIVSEVKTSYDASAAHVQLLRNTLNDMKSSLNEANQSMVEYDLLKQEAQSKANLFVTLSSRLKEIAISSSLFATNLRVVENARVPERPSSPKRVQIMALGFIFSLIAGCALAFVRENFDDTVGTIEDVKDWTGLPCLGIVPQIGSFNGTPLGTPKPAKLLNGARSRFFIDRPGSPEAEAMHSLDTSIRIPVRSDGDTRQVLVIASSFPSEGKTTIAMNLAMALSRHGNTCLVDADLRNPQIGRSFSVNSPRGGLSEVLHRKAAIDDVLQPAPRLDKLMIMPAGSTPSDPVELLASSEMRELVAQLRSKFLYVVIDSPPVIPYADSRWLSCLADGVVLVARSGTTTRQAIGLSTEILKELRVPVLGIVLNGVNLRSEYYWYGYGYAAAKGKTA